jgi:hypothetical protein
MIAVPLDRKNPRARPGSPIHVFSHALAYRRDARSNQPARKVRQTPFGGFFGAKFDILKPRWLLTALKEAKGRKPLYRARSSSSPAATVSFAIDTGEAAIALSRSRARPTIWSAAIQESSDFSGSPSTACSSTILAVILR